MKYADKLKDPRWQKKRLEILEAAEWTCQKCSNTDETLHVHHMMYEQGKNPWDYDNDVYVCLCDRCHGEYHDKRKKLEVILKDIGVSNIDYLIGYGSAIRKQMGHSGKIGRWEYPENLVVNGILDFESGANLRQTISDLGYALTIRKLGE